MLEVPIYTLWYNGHLTGVAGVHIPTGHVSDVIGKQTLLLYYSSIVGDDLAVSSRADN